MLFSCLAPGAPIPGRFPGPPHPRGRHFTVDIHCHLLTERAEAMFREAGLVERRPRDVFANAHTREVNKEQARRTRIQFTSVEKRLADMDHMGIDIQAITPAPNQTYYDTPPDLGIATARVINDNIADVVARHPDRFVGLGTVPFQAPELAVAELERLHKSLGLRGIEIATNVAGADLSERPLPADLRQGRGTRADDLHASDRLHRGAALRRSLLHQCDRQSAGYHGRGASPDLRRRAGTMPAAQAGAVAWRRLPGRPIPAASTTPHPPAPIAASKSMRCRRRI